MNLADRKSFIKYKKSSDNFFNDVSCNLSIIIPVYNAEKYLKECIESIINQMTDYNFEAIFINDGSTDNSFNILNSYSNIDYIKIFNQINSGAASARNNGINNCCGEYIAFVDSDDFISSDFVQVMLDNAYKNNADVVKCSYISFSENYKKNIFLKNKCLLKNDKYVKKIKGHACMNIIRRDLFLNLRFPEGYLYEDIIMKLLIYPRANKIIMSDKFLYYYRIYDNSTSRSLKNKKNIRCLSHYYLIKDIIEIKKDEEFDFNFYDNVMNELYGTMWLRTRYLSKDIVLFVFNDLYNIIDSIKKFNYKFSLKNYFLVFILKYKIYFLWKLFSFCKIFKVKFLKG